MTEFLTTADIAKAMQVDRSTVCEWIRTHRLRGVKFGRDWRVSAVDYEDFVAKAMGRSRPVERGPQELTYEQLKKLDDEAAARLGWL